MAAQKLTKRENAWQAIKFLIFSASAGVIQLGSFTLMNELIGWPYWPCYLTALVLSVLWNFTLNRRYTFQSAKNVPLAMLLVAAYYAVFTPLSTWWGDALTVRAGWNEYLVLAITMVINFVTEFLYSRFVIYRNSINTNDRVKALPEKLAAEAAAAELPLAGEAGVGDGLDGAEDNGIVLVGDCEPAVGAAPLDGQTSAADGEDVSAAEEEGHGTIDGARRGL